MHPSSAVSQNRIAARLAAARAQLAIQRLRLAHALKRFNPNQPRVPAGHANGGQWTSGGSGAAAELASDRVRQDRPEIQPVGGFEKDQLGITVQDFASRYCLGNIRAVLPGQFAGWTIAEVMEAAKRGDPAARTCLKVLGRERFRK
jgi:hypothetical protein